MEGGLTTIARGQDNGTTILLGLKDYKVGEVWGGEGKVIVETEVKGRIKCPYCGSGRLYEHGMRKPREILHTWSNGKKFTLSSTGTAGSVATASIPSLRAGNWYGPMPGLPGRPKPRPYGSSRKEISAR